MYISLGEYNLYIYINSLFNPISKAWFALNLNLP
jgi:hypothetical protein